MLPSTQINKVDGQTGVAKPAPTGILGIAAAAAAGVYTAGAFARQDALVSEYTRGHLCEFGAFVLAQTQKPVVAVRVDPSTDGDYSAFTTTSAGTSAITEGATEPCDSFSVLVDFPTGGTIGSAGIKYRYSINGGETYSKAQALGTANTITIPNTGVSLALGAGTVLSTTKVAFTTTAPKITNADVPTLLEAFRVTSSPYEAILIDMEADASTVGTCDLWIKAQNKRGKFPTIVLTAVARDPLTQTEAQYNDALAAIFDAAASTDVLVCADLGDVTSVIRGFQMARPVGLPVAARGMSIRLGVDPAYVALGQLSGVRITDGRNNPKYHDENIFPGLDDNRFTTLRRIDGFEGVYITNAKLLSASGSDFVFWQHARTLNRGCEITYQILTKQLSKGIPKAPKPGPNGERYIDEGAAQQLEGLVNAQLYLELVKPGEVDDMKLTLARTDDIRSNAGAKIRARLESVALAYAKEFDIDAGFVTAISGEQ